ncbi:hypothetical protein BDN72DRAFT_833125 [Pluteus cervinus]|uniref:Uncharacterized protein n=1 Tax=Pluteus cervinus TaxID=181527 RepID=A0ACD3B9D5_9AGAR|nr:hypothetical protein BDN72DRAFT_833125 [Pluteus cervinus]
MESSDSGTANSSSVGGYPTKYQDWFVQVTINPSEFPTSGYVHIFLSESVPTGDWTTSPDRVGDVAIFKDHDSFGSNNRREAAISGQVPLTRILLEKGQDINNIAETEAYLTTQLHWRCATVDGVKLPLENVLSLLVKVFSAPVERRGVGQFPRRGTPEVHQSVTHGRLGGFAIETE